jgi:hypothetical protein
MQNRLEGHWYYNSYEREKLPMLLTVYEQDDFEDPE